MTELHRDLIDFGLQALLSHSTSLFATIARDGTLIEWNDRIEQMLAATPGLSVGDLLTPSSRPLFRRLIDGTLLRQTGGPAVLHFAAGERGLPLSFSCMTFALRGDRVLFFAEQLAAIDTIAAEEYGRVVDDLAVTTRHLQKMRHTLLHKQRQMQELLERLALLARVDELTGLFNRRSITERLEEEIDRAKRYFSPLTVMLIDVDEFKRVNDRYGHQMGDTVLRRIADALRSSIRGTDHLGRYGGEELICVLPATGAVAGAELAERLRRRVINEQFTVNETIHFQVSISIGVAELDPRRDTLDDLVSHADSALYLAKSSGRNCWRLWAE